MSILGKRFARKFLESRGVDSYESDLDAEECYKLLKLKKIFGVFYVGLLWIFSLSVASLFFVELHWIYPVCLLLLCVNAFIVHSVLNKRVRKDYVMELAEAWGARRKIVICDLTGRHNVDKLPWEVEDKKPETVWKLVDQADEKPKTVWTLSEPLD